MYCTVCPLRGTDSNLGKRGTSRKFSLADQRAADNGSISPQWPHTTCGHWGVRPKPHHGQTWAEDKENSMISLHKLRTLWAVSGGRTRMLEFSAHSNPLNKKTTQPKWGKTRKICPFDTMLAQADWSIAIYLPTNKTVPVYIFLLTCNPPEFNIYRALFYPTCKGLCLLVQNCFLSLHTLLSLGRTFFLIIYLCWDSFSLFENTLSIGCSVRIIMIKVKVSTSSVG